MKYLKSFKNNNAAQNLFLFAMAMAFIAAILSMNWQAVIAWLCCFVTFVMFCGERDYNRSVTQELREERTEKLSKFLVDKQMDDKGQ